MTASETAPVAVGHVGTANEDYNGCYYASHLGSDEEYSWDSPGWRAFFTRVAEHIVAVTNPSRTFDVGCARGLLVQALAEKGVDAHGSDISSHAIETAHPDVRNRLSVATATEPIEGEWDLLTCVEVVEHMSPADADKAIANMCAASDRILFSSGPGDFTEPTHVNVRQPAEWAAAFAEHGFYRRTDVDLAFLTPWAVLFQRDDLTKRDIVHRYETYAFPMRIEVLEKRNALLNAHREISELHAGIPQERSAAEVTELRRALAEAQKAAEERLAHISELETTLRQVGEREADFDAQLVRERARHDETRAQLLDARHRLLTVRDHAIGAEATAATATARRAALENDLARAKAANEQRIKELESDLQLVSDELRLVKATTRWRVGGAVLGPAAAVKNRLRGLSS